MIFSLSRLKASLKDVPALLKSYGLLFLLLQLMNFFFTQSLSYLHMLRMSSRSDEYMGLIIFLAIVGFFVQALAKVIWALLTAFALSHDSSLVSYFQNSFHQSLIESLRAFTQAVLYGFLFIIPGLIKVVRYQFVIFVAADNKEYAQGHTDALEQSSRLTQGHFFALVGLFVTMALTFLPFSLQASILERPVSIVFNEIITFFLMLVQTAYLFRLYKDLYQNTKSKEVAS